jgi:hypothetical protein
MSRDAAVEELKKPLYDPDELENDIDYFCKKLRISRETFVSLMNEPPRHYSDFPNWDSRYRRLKSLQSLHAKIFGRTLKVYS